MKNLSIWLPPFSPDYSGAASVMFDFNALTDLIQDGRVEVTPMITHHYALKDMEKAFETFQKREAIKIMIHPEGA